MVSTDRLIARPQVAVWASGGSDCSFYGGRRDQPQVRFAHVLQSPGRSDCS
jgi:hypothetical protein